MATTIKMPQLGESVTEGTIERWLVKEGDTVEQYDPLFEVVTDKVNAEVPAEVAGTVTKIIVGDGQTVKVGTPLAEIDAGDDAGEQPASEDRAPAQVPEPAPAAVEVQAPAQTEPEAQPPRAGTQPELAAAAAEHETSRVQAAFNNGHEADGGPPTDASMRMTPAVRRLVREHGIDVARIQGSGAAGRVTREDVLSFVAQYGASAGATAPAPAQAAPTPQPVAQATPSVPAPSAPSPAPAPAPSAPPQAPAQTFAPTPVPPPMAGDTEIALSQMRKGIAAKMTRVKQTVPHAYTVVEVDMGNVVRWRAANTDSYTAREGIGISYVAVVIKAVTETLRQHPMVNSQFAEDRVILKQAMNIGIAVAVDNGLLVPVIHDADQLSISGVNRKVQDLAARARTNKLRLEEIQGGTFTVNNTGWFGSVSSMPIINAPEVAILSMEAIVKRPVVIEVDGADVIAIRPMMNMTCSFDHRVLDGAQVGYFLADVRKRLESWDLNTPIG
ncbi:MAG TPA: dihydrolipoamide acetyltransferase family protein [Candidatus Limnocylindria bacterium]|nr:dihydrolipoamide acetyltransferase family protein [Candidatus Limnocylindria bacterium]